jgi:hypothetical protein
LIVKIGTTLGGQELGNYSGQDDTGSFVLNGVEAGSVFIQFSRSTNASGQVYIDNVSCVAEPVGPADQIVTLWPASTLDKLNVAPETGMNRAIFTHPEVAPFYLQYNSESSWDFRRILFTQKPTEWGEDGQYPSICEIHKGRAYFSGHTSARNRIWASVVNDLFNMDLATLPGENPEDDDVQLPGDAMDYKVATNGAIQWMKSNTSLLIGTDLGNHSITGSKGVPLNGDIDVRREESFGSAAVPAVDAGAMTLFVSSDRKKVQAVSYNLQSNKWHAQDITFITGIVDPDPIQELHHAWTPDGVIIARLSSGNLALCTFAPDAQVVGWWRGELSSGLVRSLAVSAGPSGAYLWMSVERDGVMWLERMPLMESTDELTYLDASVERVSGANGQVLGLSHLDGRLARAYAGTVLLGDFLVTDGIAQLGSDNASMSMTLGIPYTAKAITMPKLSKGTKVRSAQVGVILNDSAPPLINNRRASERSGVTWDASEPRITGKRRGANALGWDDEGCITIEQDLPARTEILALYEATAAGEIDG